MKSRVEDKSAAGLKDKMTPTAMEAVEGTFQCPGCQRFMRLGEGKLCMTFEGDGPVIAEIVSWVPGQCERYLAADKLF